MHMCPLCAEYERKLIQVLYETIINEKILKKAKHRLAD